MKKIIPFLLASSTIIGSGCSEARREQILDDPSPFASELGSNYLWMHNSVDSGLNSAEVEEFSNTIGTFRHEPAIWLQHTHENSANPYSETETLKLAFMRNFNDTVAIAEGHTKKYKVADVLQTETFQTLKIVKKDNVLSGLILDVNETVKNGKTEKTYQVTRPKL